MKSLQIAASGMAAQQTRVTVISNNIANMSTAAYRPRVAEFSDLMYQQYLTPGTITSQVGTVVPAGIQIGTGVRSSTVSMEVTQGALRQTDAELDLAIDGAGFLEITLPSGEPAYTRDGKLSRSANGEVVTMDGFPQP
jgi:flagellar basal-body rod protein FlgG